VPGHPSIGRRHLEHGAVITQPDHGWVTGHSAGLNAAPAPVLPPHDHIHDLVPSVEPVRVADQLDPARGRPDQGARARLAWTVLIVEGAGVVMLLLTAALLWQRRSAAPNPPGPVLGPAGG
jgi:hypothetical protein